MSRLSLIMSIYLERLRVILLSTMHVHAGYAYKWMNWMWNSRRLHPVSVRGGQAGADQDKRVGKGWCAPTLNTHIWHIKKENLYTPFVLLASNLDPFFILSCLSKHIISFTPSPTTRIMDRHLMGHTRHHDELGSLFSRVNLLFCTAILFRCTWGNHSQFKGKDQFQKKMK